MQHITYIIHLEIRDNLHQVDIPTAQPLDDRAINEIVESLRNQLEDLQPDYNGYVVIAHGLRKQCSHD